MPFALNIKLESADETATNAIPKGDYLLTVDPSAIFSIIFVDTTLNTIENPITVDYSFYGENDYTIQGEWQEVSCTIQFDNEEPVTFTLTVFVSYMASPETGTDGFLGMAISSYNRNMNFA